MDQNSKGKIFFFGPGSSLKFDFPIRTNTKTASGAENESKPEERNNKHDENKEEKPMEGEQVSAPEASSDEDSDELLKKIDAVLETENGEHDIDSSNKDENASANENNVDKREITSSDEASQSALAFSQARSEKKKEQEERDAMVDSNKGESENLSSECSNSGGNAKFVNVIDSKLVETEVCNSLNNNQHDNLEKIEEKPNNDNNIEIEEIKESSSKEEKKTILGDKIQEEPSGKTQKDEIKEEGKEPKTIESETSSATVSTSIVEESKKSLEIESVIENEDKCLESTVKVEDGQKEEVKKDRKEEVETDQIDIFEEARKEELTVGVETETTKANEELSIEGLHHEEEDIKTEKKEEIEKNLETNKKSGHDDNQPTTTAAESEKFDHKVGISAPPALMIRPPQLPIEIIDEHNSPPTPPQEPSEIISQLLTPESEPNDDEQHEDIAIISPQSKEEDGEEEIADESLPSPSTAKEAEKAEPEEVPILSENLPETSKKIVDEKITEAPPSTSVETKEAEVIEEEPPKDSLTISEEKLLENKEELPKRKEEENDVPINEAYEISTVKEAAIDKKEEDKEEKEKEEIKSDSVFEEEIPAKNDDEVDETESHQPPVEEISQKKQEKIEMNEDVLEFKQEEEKPMESEKLPKDLCETETDIQKASYDVGEQLEKDRENVDDADKSEKPISISMDLKEDKEDIEAKHEEEETSTMESVEEVAEVIESIKQEEISELTVEDLKESQESAVENVETIAENITEEISEKVLEVEGSVLEQETVDDQSKNPIGPQQEMMDGSLEKISQELDESEDAESSHMDSEIVEKNIEKPEECDQVLEAAKLPEESKEIMEVDQPKSIEIEHKEQQPEAANEPVSEPEILNESKAEEIQETDTHLKVPEIEISTPSPPPSTATQDISDDPEIIKSEFQKPSIEVSDHSDASNIEPVDDNQCKVQVSDANVLSPQKHENLEPEHDKGNEKSVGESIKPVEIEENLKEKEQNADNLSEASLGEKVPDTVEKIDEKENLQDYSIETAVAKDLTVTKPQAEDATAIEFDKPTKVIWEQKDASLIVEKASERAQEIFRKSEEKERQQEGSMEDSVAEDLSVTKSQAEKSIAITPVVEKAQENEEKSLSPVESKSVESKTEPVFDDDKQHSDIESEDDDDYGDDHYDDDENDSLVSEHDNDEATAESTKSEPNVAASHVECVNIENKKSKVLNEENVEEPRETELAVEEAVEKPFVPDESINNLKLEKSFAAEMAKEEKEEKDIPKPKPPVETFAAEKPNAESTQTQKIAHETNSIEETAIGEKQNICSMPVQEPAEAKSVQIKDKLPQLPAEIASANKKPEESVQKREFQKPQVTRKRKLSERKSISESDSDGGSNLITDSAVSNDNRTEEEEEEVVVSKKPRIRGKVVATRNTRATRQSMRTAEETKLTPEVKHDVADEKKPAEKLEEKTLQNFKFDYDENEDVAANVAAIKTLICKEGPAKEESDKSSDEGSVKKKTPKRKSKRGRTAKKSGAHASSSDEEEEDAKAIRTPDSKRTKTSESEEPSEKQKKKRESGGKGLLKYIDTSLVIETVETEAPIRQSRRIAQQKIKEENDRRLMEERLLKQMKDEAERKKKGVSCIPEPEEHENDRSSDESYKGSKRKKKKKEKLKQIDPSRPWQTSSSHSEHSESEDDFEHPRSEDPGSPLFRSDHEFSPESDVDDTTAPPQPVKRARTAKKQVEESSDEEDVNPNHACQVCHKTDSPEWILLCDECDHGYHCSCLKPIIFCIPSGNWYCPLCCHKKLIENLSTQLEKLDALVHEIEVEEIRKQKQLEIKKLAEITAENIISDRRKNRPESNRKRETSKDVKSENESSGDESNSNDEDSSSSDNSSDNAPLIYKLRRNRTTASYRFNDYDELINSAIRDEMEEVKGMGNAGRGKDISTIIEADKEEKKMQKLEKERAAAAATEDEKDDNEKEHKEQEEDDDGESSDSEIVRPAKKSLQQKKKNRKLNNLEDTSEEDNDEDFRESSSSVSEEDYSMSSVSESSLDLPLKKNKAGQRSTRSAARNRRYDETFIDDNSSDDEPLIKKRTKKQVDSDEDDFDGNDEENSDGSTADEIDSDDLCDDTDTDSSSEGNWPKKKKRVASYDVKKPRRPAKKDDDEDKAFRAGISKKKILKKSENESEPSDDDSVKGRRKTRGKKLLYLIEDDYESDDGIKPGIGVIRPETPPEEREMFVKKQEEIKRMLAAKNTEGARQLAVPTIEPIKLDLQKPKSPSPPPPTNESSSSLSTIPKNVIEGAKALDMDYNRLKPLQFGIHSKLSGEGSSSSMPGQEMSEEELARMMEEEDFAQHQLKLAGEAIARSNKLLELEGKEEAFAPFSKHAKLKKEEEKLPVATPVVTPPQDPKKRARKPKTDKLQAIETLPPAAPPALTPPVAVKPIETHSPHNLTPQHIMPPGAAAPPQHRPHIVPSGDPMQKPPQTIPSIPPLIPNTSHSHPPFANLPPPRYVNPNQQQLPPHIQDRPSVLSNFMPRHESVLRHELMAPQHQPLPPSSQHLRFMPHQAPPPEAFAHKTPPMPHLQPHPAQTGPPTVAAAPGEEVEEKKKGRRKKYTPLRTDLPESKVAKLDMPPASSVIQHSTMNLTSADRLVDDKSKGLPLLTPQRSKTVTAIANAPQPFGSPIANPTPSVITRLLQPQQGRIGSPYGGGFVEQMSGPPTAPPSTESSSQQTPPPPPSATSRAFPDDPKHIPVSKQARPSPSPGNLPQPPFNEHTFVPRSMHPLYRGPPTSQPSIYGLPHARIPYPFHHLHPNSNLRPNMQEYAAPYNIPAQFGYYAAPPAHGRHPQNPPTATPLVHAHTQSHADDPSRSSNDEAAPSESSTSEFGGLVSYFSSQQELD